MVTAAAVDTNYQLDVFVRARNGELIPVPDDLVCPISIEIMREPVLPRCGHAFDRSYGSNLNWIQSKGCVLCRAPCKLEELKFDHEKWKRIKPILDKELPQTWREKIQDFFERLSLSMKNIYPVIFESIPTMLNSLRSIAQPVYERALDIQQGRCKNMGMAPLHSEWRFARTVILSVACLVRDVFASVICLIGWCFSSYFSKPLAKRVSLVSGTMLHLVGLCYWQPANRRMYMSENQRQNYLLTTRMESMENDFVDAINHIEAEMALRLSEARESLYLQIT